jgi:hypothetical protein
MTEDSMNYAVMENPIVIKYSNRVKKEESRCMIGKTSMV